MPTYPLSIIVWRVHSQEIYIYIYIYIYNNFLNKIRTCKIYEPARFLKLQMETVLLLKTKARDIFFCDNIRQLDTLQPSPTIPQLIQEISKTKKKVRNGHRERRVSSVQGNESS